MDPFTFASLSDAQQGQVVARLSVGQRIALARELRPLVREERRQGLAGGLGSFFSKAFQKVTGTKLSEATPFIAQAANFIPGVGPIISAGISTAGSFSTAAAAARARGVAVNSQLPFTQQLVAPQGLPPQGGGGSTARQRRGFRLNPRNIALIGLVVVAGLAVANRRK